MRGGVRPTRYYIPSGSARDPRKNTGIEYAFGATAKYWDKLTLDADVGITHFTQTDNANVTFQAQAQYDFNDYVRLKLGARRLPPYNSLVSVAGPKPHQGAFRGDGVGQARENTFYGELGFNPFSPNWDVNLGYEWGFITGKELDTNYKNQAFASAGYTWHYHPRNQLRIGYEFLYFGYRDNATTGYFDTTSAGTRRPVVSLNPLTLAARGTEFGGYFSPDWFVMNSLRLDLQGSLFNKFLEYKLGGAIGIQNFKDGTAGSDSAFASAFDANLIMNLTDWLALYGNVDYLDGGGQFNRWRFGTGLILRPKIDSLSPVFGPHVSNNEPEPAPAATESAPSSTAPMNPTDTPTGGMSGDGMGGPTEMSPGEMAPQQADPGGEMMTSPEMSPSDPGGDFGGQ